MRRALPSARGDEHDEVRRVRFGRRERFRVAHA